ncbi:hypothetical protein DPMN_032335 [Dreissena polymorpha]|uniref:Uncharacterized protein n=1 Tax=Dreissena polymorpha TaxID=45954 RepID=A0A9D4RI55_DREPO|nr:hypothetical protein DPMN_032335 [Dreissena polymorpha]
MARPLVDMTRHPGRHGLPDPLVDMVPDPLVDMARPPGKHGSRPPGRHGLPDPLVHMVHSSPGRHG